MDSETSSEARNMVAGAARECAWPVQFWVRSRVLGEDRARDLRDLHSMRMVQILEIRRSILMLGAGRKKHDT